MCRGGALLFDDCHTRGDSVRSRASPRVGNTSVSDRSITPGEFPTRASAARCAGGRTPGLLTTGACYALFASDGVIMDGTGRYCELKSGARVGRVPLLTGRFLSSQVRHGGDVGLVGPIAGKAEA